MKPPTSNTPSSYITAGCSTSFWITDAQASKATSQGAQSGEVDALTSLNYRRSHRRDDGATTRTSRRKGKGDSLMAKLPNNPVKQSGRKCKFCKQRKPLSAFEPWGNKRRRICKTCSGKCIKPTKKKIFLSRWWELALARGKKFFCQHVLSCSLG